MSGLNRPDILVDAGAVRSRQFDDIYFQPEDGLAETQHVFLAGNDLTDRFAALGPGQRFVIGELGFGTGLNFLGALVLFEEVAPPGAHLHFWSVEGFPLDPPQFRAILSDLAARFAPVATGAAALGPLYPSPRPGQIQLMVTPRVTLTLAFGDALSALDDALFAADAWFLDGFSPAQNPDMWSPALMNAVARHTGPGGTVATFTVAGAVRRALSGAGFTAEKTPGFGRKREMLRGQWAGGAATVHESISQVVGQVVGPTRPQRIGIVGAGIAGLACAAHAIRQGHSVQLIDAVGPGAGASGNPVGLIMPRVEAANGPSARLYRDSFLYAQHFYGQLTPAHITFAPGEITPSPDHPHRFARVLETGLWATDDLQLGPGGEMQVARGATLAPAAVARALAQGVPIAQHRLGEGPIKRTDLTQILPDCDHIILATGPMVGALAPEWGRDLRGSRGQVDLFDGTPPQKIRTGNHYVAAFGDGLAAGATYDDVPLTAQVTADTASTERNRTAAINLVGPLVGSPRSGRAAVRATVRDSHPMVGPIDDLGFGITGLGSRGLSTGPLLAAHLIAQLTGGVSPLGATQSQLIHPARFAQRRARRGQS